MKINGVMVLHHISRYFDVEYASCGQDIYVKAPMLYNEFFRMDHHIVLVTAKDIQQCAERVRDSILICLDRPAFPVESPHNDLIILNDPFSDKLIWNILMYIIEYFEDWDFHLNEILYKTMSFQEMVDLTSAVAGAPIALIDRNFKYIAYTDDESVRRFVDESNQLPLRDVNDLTAVPGFGQLETIREAFVYEAGEAVVYKNIFSEGYYVGRLSILLDEESDCEYDMAVLNHLGGYVEKLYSQCRSFQAVPYRLSQIHCFLEESLAGKNVAVQDFQKILEANGAERGDVFRMIRFVPNTPDRTVHRVAYLCAQAEHMWPGVYCVSCGDGIAALLNPGQFSRGTDREFSQELSYFLRESLMLAGISRDFPELSEIQAAYTQSSFALEQGTTRRPMHWYHYFDDYALDYLLKHGAGSFLPRQICHPAILALEAYDHVKGTSFCRTLFVYLNCQYNAAASAKILYIHRSSFINRMERIQELVSLNLQDMDERLYIMLSFKLLGYSG